MVNFYLRTQPAPESIVRWSIDAPEAMKSVKNAVESFLSLQNFANDAALIDRRLGFVAFLSHDRFSLEGTYIGDIDTFTSTALTALLRALPKKGDFKAKFHQVDWLTLVQLLAGDRDLEVSLDYAEHHMFFSKSAVVSHPGLSRDALKNYFKYLLREGPSAPMDYYINAQLYGGADSQITANKAADAFGHRDAMWTFQHYGFVHVGAQFPEEGIRFVKGLTEALGPGHGASNNYVDDSLEPDSAGKLYYGENLGRLMKLKGVLDPHNVFCHPQSVRKE